MLSALSSGIRFVQVTSCSVGASRYIYTEMLHVLAITKEKGSVS